MLLWVITSLKALVVSLSKKPYPNCLVLAGSRNMIYISKLNLIHNQTKINKYKLNFTGRLIFLTTNL